MCEQHSGFAAVWEVYEFDLTLSVKPALDWELHGDASTMFSALPLLICYLLAFGMESVAMTTLIIMSKWLYYAESKVRPEPGAESGEPATFASTTSGAKRGDIFETFAGFVKDADETFIEFHNSSNARASSSSTTQTYEIMKKTNDSAAAHASTVRRWRKAAGTNRKDSKSELRQIREIFDKPSFAPTKTKIKEMIKSTFSDAMNGKFDHLQPERKIMSGARRMSNLIAKTKEFFEKWHRTTGWHLLKINELQSACDKFKLSKLGTKSVLMDTLVTAGKFYFIHAGELVDDIDTEPTNMDISNMDTSSTGPPTGPEAVVPEPDV